MSVDRTRGTFVASCAAIPGYMEAMSMPFTVREAEALKGIEPGSGVEFTLVVEGTRSWAEGIHIRASESMEQEALRARRLQLLQGEASGLQAGQRVPDFTLTDQTGHRVTLSRLSGKVVALTFVYTSCPLPDYCFRLSNNFGLLSKRFARQMPSDLVFLSVSFDPLHDSPEVLAKYAKTWNASAASWHFLTGSIDEVKAVCRIFGLNFWQDEGLLTHSLRTVVIDRQGLVFASLDGNDFSARQLGDIIEAAISSGASARKPLPSR